MCGCGCPFLRLPCVFAGWVSGCGCPFLRLPCVFAG